MSCVLCNWELAISYVDNFSIQLDYFESYSTITTNQKKNLFISYFVINTIVFKRPFFLGEEK